MRGILVFLLAIGSTGVLAGQEVAQMATIRLLVQSDSGPISAAQVMVGEISAVTDQSGVATIAVNPGNLDVTVSREGFISSKTSITVAPGQTQEVVLELQPNPTAEQEIIVSATRTEMRLEDVPIRVEVIQQEDIEEELMMKPGDIAMMLNEMGGLRVQQTSPSLGAASVRILGMKGRYTRFLADGLPLFGEQVGGLGILQIPPMDLGKVEVIKGVASALYGAGAMGGVVNLISRRPGMKPSYEFLFNQSTRGATDFVPFIMRPLSDHWKVSVLGGAHLQQENDVNHDGWADLAGYTRGVLRPRLFWDDGNGRTAFLTGGATYEDRQGGTLRGAVLPATGLPYVEALNTRRYDFGGSADFVIAKNYVIALSGAGVSQWHDHFFGSIRERDRHDSVFTEASVRHTAGRHTWVAGFGLDQDEYHPLDVPRFAYDYTTPGLFLQDDIVISPWLSVSASGRLDFHSQYGLFASPRISALLRGKKWISRLSLGQGFFGPTPLTEETEAAGLTRLVIPQPLRAERGRSGSLDITRSVGPGTYTVTVFGSRVNNPLFVERNRSYELANLTQASTNVGLEFLATFKHGPFSGTATYTYVQPRETENGQRVDVELTPRHNLGFVGMWENENSRIGAECYYTGQQRLEVNPYRSSSLPYILVGLLAEHSFGHFRIFVNTENLTNIRQTRWDPLLRPSQGPDGRWTVDAWAPLDGRVLNGGLRLNF
jgi:outer membrane receptor for ferrienterochelin and colicins